MGASKHQPLDSAGDGHLLRVFFELGDHLGSTSVALDKGTGELVERSTYQVYGGAESSYRPSKWGDFREDYRFTGKEEDVEVGLTYFGKRFYNALLQRWVSADPLQIHALGSDLNSYAYVSGGALRNVDPLGLAGEDAQSGSSAASQPTPVPFGPEDASPGTRFVFGGGPDRLVPQAEYDQATPGKQEFVYDPNADLGDIDPNKLSDAAFTQVVKNAINKALSGGGNCSGPACGTARPGEQGSEGPTDTSDAIALAGGLTEGVGPEAGGKRGGTPGGSCATCQGGNLQQAAAGVARLGANLGVGQLAKRAVKQVGKALARKAATQFPRKTLTGMSLKWLKRNKPRGWTSSPTREHEGFIWRDATGQERLRFMRPNGNNPANSQWSRQANGYFRWNDEAGNFLDASGKVVPDTHPQFQELTHIVYEGPL